MAGFANTAPNDGHLNERGHAVVARELVRAICEIASGRATASELRLDRTSPQNPGFLFAGAGR